MSPPVVWGSAEVGETSTPSVVRRTRRRRASSSVSHASSSSVNLLPSYLDCGDPDYVCAFCSAVFWFDERVVRLSRRNRPAYSQCCKNGAVVLAPPLRPPSVILGLYQDRHFFANIRAYNSMFAMTSFGARVDDAVNDGRGPYTFKVSGQVSHWIGSLCPQPLEKPRFLQLYVYDTENEIQNRLDVYENSNNSVLRPDIVAAISETLNCYNEYVRTFKNASRIATEHNLDDYSVRLYNDVRDSRYGPPQPGTLGAIVVADDPNASRYDIIVSYKYGFPKRISKLHHSYMALQYPLLFPFGEKGWSTGLRLRGEGGSWIKNLTVNMYYSYLLHSRLNVFTLLLNAGRLLQQFMVDAYLCVEENRLDYIRNHQNELRSEYVGGVYDAISRGDSEGRHIGKRTFLPATFIGGPRYMYKHYQDALALCRVYGNPQYFITFTCNVRWPEITRFMDAAGVGQAQNRPDIIARVFHMKVSQFITFLKEDKTFGNVTAFLYTIEFQKRGLPHCHTLLWVDTDSKIRTAADVDRYISAELPDPETESALYSTVTSSMLHGPCGLLDLHAPCMRDGTCKKGFPKPFNEKTYFDKDGYVHYKRADHTSHTLPNGVQVHNGYVVPYNKRVSSRFNAHINVEYCGWNMMIKYLFKYISKGVERISFTIQRAERATEAAPSSSSEVVDEIHNFVDARFICPHEAAWRILNFSIHERHPAVQVLAVHLEEMQNTTFQDNAQLTQLVNSPSFGKTTLTRWLVNNRWDPDGRHLKYTEYTSMFRWDPSSKDWIYRTRNTVPSVGRLVYVHPTAGELFYLRMLLCHQKGCKTFSDIRTVEGVVFPTFQLACEALGLIGDDREWLHSFIDASHWASSSELRTLFCHLLLFCDVTNATVLWENAWPKMGDDIRRTLASASSFSAPNISDDLVKQHILLDLEKSLNAASPPKTLKNFNLPMPSRAFSATLRNRLLLEESLYDTVDLQEQHARMVAQLNPEQLRIYNKIQEDFSLNKQTLIFVYGHGGTGKTFLWSVILAYYRSIGKVVLAVAASGIASLLLPNGRTAHSRFKIPINLTNTSMCNIKKRTQLSELLKETSLVIWDEATMTDRKCFECVDRTFRDILGKKDTVFGGMPMLLGGDFRQTLPVKRKRSIYEVVSSTLPNSYLWSYFTVYKLLHNMRLSTDASDPSTLSERTLFASWLLDIGNGTVGTPDADNPDTTSHVQIPGQFLITDEVDPLNQLIDFVYDSNVLHTATPTLLCNRAIVCPTNATADQINSIVLQKINNESVSYFSSDSITAHTHRVSDLELLYPEEYLNRFTFPGLPLHQLTLKKNVPVLLLRNMNQKLGLCNGTRLLVTQLFTNVIEATIMTGTCIGKRVYIPRIKFIHNDPELPFLFVRKQFPCKLCYAMTINKIQGQSLQRIGVYLPTAVFSHGHLYVALSRATSPDSIKVLALDESGKPTNNTKNIVFRDLLRHIDAFHIGI